MCIQKFGLILSELINLTSHSMDGLKYSLKTNQFTKRKHAIFEKKQSTSSLLIREPPTDINLSSLSPANESDHIHHQNQSSSFNIELPQPEETSHANSSWFSTKTVKQYLGAEDIEQAQRVKLHSPQKKKGDKCQDIEQCSSQAMSELIWTRHLLLKNEERINGLMDSMNSLSKSTAQLYENHAQYMLSLVNRRCGQLSAIFKKIVLFLIKKTENIDYLDQRLSIFYNTIKDTKQTLRVLSIKQECIELELTAKNKPIDTTIKFNPITSARDRSLNDDKSISNKTSFNFDFFSENNIRQDASSRNGKFKKIENPFIQESPIVQWGQTGSLQAAESLFSEDQPIKMKETYFFRDSPPSVRSPLDEYSPSAVFSPENLFDFESHHEDKASNQYTFCSRRREEPTINNYESTVKKVKRATEPQQALWLDNLSCLRTSHGGYLLDQQGNAVICSENHYRRLVQDRVILQYKKSDTR